MRDSNAIAEGVRLAQARRTMMRELIRQNPRRAVALAASWRWRQELPQAIREQLEEIISGSAKLDVYCALPMPGAEAATGGTIRYVTIQQKTYRAYVYGRRLNQESPKTVALHGVAVDNDLAVAEEPLRDLDTDETAARLSAGQRPESAACAYCGNAAAAKELPVLAEYHGRMLSFCGQPHAAKQSLILAQAESVAGGVGAEAPSANPQGSTGSKHALYLRVVFADDDAEPITAAEAAVVMRKVNDFYVEASYDKTAIISTISPLLVLPQTKMTYAVTGPGSLAEDARAMARQAGYEPADYDLVLIRHPSVPGFTWGGLGGGGTAWLQSSDPGTAAHEIGHNYGLGHANFWNTRRDALPTDTQNLPFDADSLVGRDSIIGPGDDVAYGDPYDIMGSGGGESIVPGVSNGVSTMSGHFNAVGKHLLGWLPLAYINTVSSGGTNRLYVHDTPSLLVGRAYALNVRKDDQRTYWVSARSRFLENVWEMGGVELHWGPWQQSIGYSHLLDTTPGTANGSKDAPILVGRTFSDYEAGIHITPVAKGGFGVESWCDVVVNLGLQVSNVAPVVTLSYSTNRPPRGQAVTFKASATDANGDAMAYFWDFGDGTFGTNAASVTKTWATNGDFVVRCEVSDMRGGVTIKHAAIRVGTVSTLRISGTVTDLVGQPLAGMRVSNGALTNNDLAADYKVTYTDSDGAYTLTGLSTNTSYPIGAYKSGYSTRPLNFSLPVQLDSLDAVDADFQASPLPQISVATLTNASKNPVVPGLFTLARTGDTNTALRALFLLGGTAAASEYAPYTNLITLTNVNADPFGAITSVYDFQYVDFAPGAATTNITIKPVANSASEESYVALSLMHPLQSGHTNDPGNPTNLTWVSFTGWEIQTNNGVSAWFQTIPDYVPGYRSEAKLLLRGQTLASPVVSIVASDPIVYERTNNAGRFTLTRQGRLDLPVTVALQWGGTATAGEDYVALPAYATIAKGETSVQLPVVVLPDKYLEQNETVEAKVLSDAAYRVGNDNARVTIVESGMPLVTITSTRDTISETDSLSGVFTVTRYGDLTEDLAVHYLVTGTAVSGQDYRALPGAVTILAGNSTAAIEVTPRNNGKATGDLKVIAFLSDSPTYDIGSPDSATMTIQDSTLPTVTIEATQPNASEAGTAGEFTVRRTGSLSSELWVYFSTGGTARQLIDYAAIGDHVRIPAGVRLVAFALTPLDDGMIESPNETVTLTLLTNAAYNVGSPGQATVTIADSGSGQLGVEFSTLASSVPASVGTAQVAVVISGNPADGANVTVDYKINGGTAIPGLDYPATNSAGRLVFTNNPATDEAKLYASRVQFISVPIFDGHQVRPDRNLVIELVAPAPDVTNQVTVDIGSDSGGGSVTNTTTNIVVTPVPMNAIFGVYQTHTLTIVDDNASTVTVAATTAIATEAGAKVGIFTLSRTATNGAQKVYFALNGRAVNGRHYQAINSPVVIPSGKSSITIPVVPLDDAVQTFMADVTISLIEAPGARIGSPAAATINIVGNDGAVEFAQSRFYTTPSLGLAQIPVQRTGDTSGVVSVEYVVAAGTATNGVDFLATNGTLVFNAGEILKYLPVRVLDNGLALADRTINLLLRHPSDGAPLGGQNQALLTIVDDRSSVEFVQSVYQVVRKAGIVAIKVQRSGILTNDFTVGYVFKESGATSGAGVPGEDFVASTGSIHFSAGQTEATFDVQILGNPLAQGDRTALLVLTNPIGKAVIGDPGMAALVIIDDSCQLDFTAASSVVQEYAQSVTLTLQRTGSTLWPVTVDYTTVPGTALPNKDYFAQSGTIDFLGDSSEYATNGSGSLEFHAGETNKTIQVTIIDNNSGDGDRQFSVVLSNPQVLAALASGTVALGSNFTHTITIWDDEIPGGVDTQFNPGQGADGPVAALALQPDAKLVVGGEFTRMDDVILNRVARLHSDGYLDSFLNPGGGTDGAVYATAIQSNGRVLIAGNFTQLNGVNHSCVARLNADGTNDDSFVGPSLNGAVRAMALHTNGTIWIGGDFTTAGNASRSGIARLSPGGTLDSNFDPGAGTAGSSVYALAAMDDGSVIIGGAFNKIKGASIPYLARLGVNGTVNSSFSAAGGPNGVVRAIVVQSDGGILIGGDFTMVAGVARGGVARLKADGSLDRTFDSGAGANGAVYALGALPDGKVYVGGDFTNYDGATMNHFGRLNANGSIDDDFGFGSGADAAVRCLVVQPNTAVIIGGDFTTVRGVARNHIARIHGDDLYIPDRVQFTAAEYRALADSGQAFIMVKRSGHTNSAMSIGYLTADGTAKAGINYTATQGTLDFAAGETRKSFTVPLLKSAASQGDLALSLLLTNIPPGYKLDGQLSAALVIESVYGAFSFAAADFLAESDDGAATITVTRTGTGSNAATIAYATQGGTAVSGVDYSAVSGTLTFKAGVTNLSFTIPLISIASSGDDKTVGLQLSNPQGGTVLGYPATGTLTIHNVNQGPFHSVSFAASLAGTITPGSSEYTVGTVKQFTALPLPDYQFKGWKGTINATANPLALTINQDYELAATFEPRVLTYDFAPPFAAASLTNAPWSSSGALPWVVVSGATNDAEPCFLRAGAIGNSQESVAELRVVTRAGVGSFHVRASCEEGWDKLEFSLNGELFQSWSGEVPWQDYQFAVKAGTNRFAWRYVKDASFTAGLDAAFLSQFYVPIVIPGAQLQWVSMDSGQWLQINGAAGHQAILETSSDLTDWTPISTNLLVNPPILVPMPAIGNSAAQFYRVSTP